MCRPRKASPRDEVCQEKGAGRVASCYCAGEGVWFAPLFGGLIQWSKQRERSQARGFRIGLSIAPFFTGILICVVIFASKLPCSVRQACIEPADPIRAYQVAFFSGAGASVLLGIGFMLTRKSATESPRRHHPKSSMWLSVCVLLAVMCMALAIAEILGQGSRLISTVQILSFLGIVATLILHLRGFRQGRTKH
jgi:NADH:ubiquinone oxidoreductase subunit 6 (subunit J)